MPEVSRHIELGLIIDDIADCLQLVHAMQTDPNGAVYSFAIMGAIGLVVEESFRLISPMAELTELANANLRKARSRLKMFDDTEGYSEGFVQVLSIAQTKGAEWFSLRHQGLLGSLKRYLQPDLGTYWLGQHLIATTHTALPALGLTQSELDELTPTAMNNLGRTLFDYGQRGGAALAAIATALASRGFSLPPRNVESNVIPISHNDFKSDRFYSAATLALKVSDERHAAAAVFAVAQMNTAIHLLPRLLDAGSNLLLRFQVLTAYHGMRTLDASCIVRTSDDEPFWLASPATIPRSARNLCAHYGLRKGALFAGGSSDPLGAAIEGICGIPRAQLKADVRRWLNESSAAAVVAFSKNTMKPYRALFGDHT